MTMFWWIILTAAAVWACVQARASASISALRAEMARRGDEALLEMRYLKEETALARARAAQLERDELTRAAAAKQARDDLVALVPLLVAAHQRPVGELGASSEPDLAAGELIAGR
jgi:hypothetical protein